MGVGGSYFYLFPLIFWRHDHIGSKDPIGGCTDTGVRSQHLAVDFRHNDRVMV